MEKFPTSENKEPLEKIDAIFTESGIEQARIVRSPSGSFIFVTEHAGKDGPNEDGLVINTERDAFCVIDAMGGMNNPILANRIVTEEFLRAFREGEDMRLTHLATTKRMIQENPHGAACYTAIRINKKTLEVQQGGDTGIIVVNAINKKVKLGLWKELHADTRESIIGDWKGEKPSRAFTELQNGDRIYLASDGLWANVQTGDLLKKTPHIRIDKALAYLRERALREMTERVRPEFANPDNLTIFIYDKQPGI